MTWKRKSEFDYIASIQGIIDLNACLDAWMDSRYQCIHHVPRGYKPTADDFSQWDADIDASLHDIFINANK